MSQMIFTEKQLSNWEAYERVRQSGITNMFDVRRGRELAGLTKENYMFSLSNYSQLKAAAQAAKDRAVRA